MTHQPRQVARIIVEPIDSPVDIPSALAGFAGHSEFALLDSAASGFPFARYSVLACEPAATVCIHPAQGGCPFQTLSNRIARFPPAERSSQLPISCAWMGFVTYEAGLSSERIDPWPKPGMTALPWARFSLYDSACVYDGHNGQWYATAVEWPQPFRRRRPPVEDRLSKMRRRLTGVKVLHDDDNATAPGSGRIESALTYECYRLKVDQILRHIAAGDVYQVNLTNRFTVRTDLSPVELYLRLRHLTPAPYAALLAWDGRRGGRSSAERCSLRQAILSASPELFLSLDGRHVVTRPIKGTRPRGSNPDADDANRRELQRSEKDHAELAMIVDLLRNDLGRVCSYGSIRVTDAGCVESHPTVYHRVATVEGELAPARSWPDLLRAAFPGGSVTGAPKIRAMQLIDALEPVARGVYCGSIGYLGLDGSMRFNLAIRTMLQRGRTAHFHAGGGIVADSNPDDEYEEMLAKAAAMMRAVGSDHGADVPPIERARKGVWLRAPVIAARSRSLRPARSFGSGGELPTPQREVSEAHVFPRLQP